MSSWSTSVLAKRDKKVRQSTMTCVLTWTFCAKQQRRKDQGHNSTDTSKDTQFG